MFSGSRLSSSASLRRLARGLLGRGLLGLGDRLLRRLLGGRLLRRSLGLGRLRCLRLDGLLGRNLRLVLLRSHVVFVLSFYPAIHAGY